MQAGCSRISAELEGNKRFAGDARALVGRGPEQREHFGFAHALVDLGQRAVGGDCLLCLR